MRLASWDGKPLEPGHAIWVCHANEVGPERPRGYRWIGTPEKGRLVPVFSEMTEPELDARVEGLRGAIGRASSDRRILTLSRKLTKTLEFLNRPKRGRKKRAHRKPPVAHLLTKPEPHLVIEIPPPEPAPELAPLGVNPHARAPVVAASFIATPSTVWQVRQEFLRVDQLRSVSLLHAWGRRSPVFPPGDDRGEE